MKTSETITKIAPALLRAQQAITFAAKDAKNPHFKSTYASLPAVIDAVKSALNDNGIVFIQTNAPSESGFLCLSTRLLHESGEWIEDTATIPLPKNDPQGYGSAATYGRRYALAAITGLYQDDDDGNAASNVKPQPAKATKSAEPKLTETQVADIIALADECQIDVEQILEAAKIETLSQMEATRYSGLITWIKDKRSAA